MLNQAGWSDALIALRRRPRPRCASKSRIGAGEARRSSSEPGSPCPVTQTELRLVFNDRQGRDSGWRGIGPSRTSS